MTMLSPRSLAERIQLHYRKWLMTFRAYRLQMRKKHGAARPPRRQAWFIARCAGWIAAGQHLSSRGPYYKWLRREDEAR